MHATSHHNALGQPIGEPLPDWQSPPPPARATLPGRYCTLEPLTPLHAEALYQAAAEDHTGASWTYLPYGPFSSLAEYESWVQEKSQSTDPLFFAIVDKASHTPLGVASFLRINPADGVIEVGHLYFSPRLQRTIAATECQYLMMRYAFELGYRRYEWKCDALNAPSRQAAVRLGFTFEGHFRQAVVTRGRNRDTSWYSIIDTEWPHLRAAFEAWLAPTNFNEHGQQTLRLSELTAAALAK